MSTLHIGIGIQLCFDCDKDLTIQTPLENVSESKLNFADLFNFHSMTQTLNGIACDLWLVALPLYIYIYIICVCSVYSGAFG